MELKQSSLTYKSGAARAFAEARLKTGVAAFALADFCSETRLSKVAALRQLQRMGPWIAKLPRKEFFLIVSPEHQTMGAPPTSWWLDDYFRWLHHPYYVALQSAAAVYGSEPQGLQTTQVITDLPQKVLTIGRLQIQFFLKRLVSQTPTQMQTGARAPVKVSSPAATLLDLIRYSRRIGGLARAWETGSPLLPQVSPGSLMEALQAANEPALGQRLGYLLEQRKHPLTAVAARWLPPSPSWTPLVVGSLSTACPRIERWRIIQNEKS